MKFSLLTGQTNAQFWESNNQNPYSTNILSQINDTQSTQIQIPVTSIPSPFARMQLFDTAFEFIVRNNDFNGNSLYHKLVSDCLDVYEILFRIEELNLTADVRIEEWTVNDLDNLDNNDLGQKTFTETIKLFIEKYNTNNNDNPFNNLFIVYYRNQPIAGTSPYTGFFTTANEISHQINLFGERIFFDGTPVPIYERADDFQKFLNIYIQSKGLTNTFRTLSEYLVKARNYVNNNNNLSNYFQNIANNNNDINNFTDLTYNNNPLYIYPTVTFCKKTIAQSSINNMIANSDYLSTSSKTITKPPIVLLKGIRNSQWIYLRDSLNPDIEIPNDLDPNFNNRILPETSHQYPFITKNDLLSEYIVELDYKLNSNKFFLGTNQNPDKGFLLPIKADYFKFFTINDLKENLIIEVNTDALGKTQYDVTLNIPIKGNNNTGKITFNRTYLTYDNINNKPENNGAVISERYGGTKLFLGFYPFFKVGNIDDNGNFSKNAHSVYNDFYKTLVYYENSLSVECDFYKLDSNSDQLAKLPTNESGIATSRTSKAENQAYVTDYYELSNDINNKDRDITYDLINLKIRKVGALSVEAIIIPEMYIVNTNNATAQTYLSFDIGTTNSFVAFATNINNPNRFTTQYTNHLTNNAEYQLTMLHAPILDNNGLNESEKYDLNSQIGKSEIQKAFLNEFMPTVIADNSHYKLPIKTAICWDNDANIGNSSLLNILSNINIPFAFGIEKKRPLDQISTNLKWNVNNVTSQAPANQLKAFIKQLVIMSRNTLLLNGYNPALSRIIWFKPLTMSTGISRTFYNIWQDVYSSSFSKLESNNPQYQNSLNNLQMMSESAAPFYYLRPSNLGNFFLNIDIGGGTSDMVVYNRQN